MPFNFLLNLKGTLTKGIFIMLMQVACIYLLAQTSLAPSPQSRACPIVTGFKIFNNDLPLDSILQLKTINLASDESSFSISIAADTTRNDSAVYYMLDGADNDWIKAGKSATVNYTQLAPGRYDFKLKCNDQQEQTALEIVIKLPFWLSSWFIIICCVAF